MNHNSILLGKRYFLYSTAQVVEVEGWTFTIAPGFKMIAGGSANPLQTLISMYRENEKVAQLVLHHRRSDSDVTVQAVSSELLLEIAPATRTVSVAEKQ
ncbi:hypothetical protein BAG01nite_13500 [Brevibacillus agri]|uniref:Uncharacterized protein n=1 Tax=Brevibacillus agri TaxID=51101 RepID=A0A3M8ASR7_9BACL|nr:MULTISPECIES: hypothetical protein [Brevibacillus]ELK42849.1 hypothetical protein D478_06599 [Brevibacillus agri BAB-2500]EJL41912.1 hypothetical protein PMI08_03500 [Brevibacillus sp. CF112]MBG9568246.1 hypothetical protein [Brevibacillus agri]MBY0051822.1 hypothetical protein [Brevibacillus agri]MCG5251536.1 hypothetical protein [Brevibacillus agri]